MKKINYLFIILMLLVTGKVSSQDFPWPDLGTPVVITPGGPGVINNTINAATSATHFVLKRDAIYIYTDEMKNPGFPIMVTAEEGEGALPIIKALGPPSGAEEATRPFFAQGDMYLKDLELSGWDQGGNFTDNATVRLASDGITVVIKNVVFDFNRQNAIRINAKDCYVYVENTIFGNQGIAQRLYQGFALTFRGNMTPVVHMRNNTFYNMHNEVINNIQPASYNKLIFEHNTVVNTGTGGLYFGRPDSIIFRNNLFINAGIMGDGFVGNRENFVQPHYYLSIDSTFVDDELKKPYVDFDYNHFYLDPAVAALLPDTSKKATLSFIHPLLADLIGENNVIADEAFALTNFPATVDQYKSYIDDFYAFVAEPAQMPLFDEDYKVLNFSYVQTHDAYSSASDGGPLGDRNWFPDFVPVNVPNEVVTQFRIYPNPVQNNLFIANTDNFTHLRITNIVGQTIMDVRNLGEGNININVSELKQGLYIVSFFNGEKPVGSVKMLKR
jgi:hypothetical protein